MDTLFYLRRSVFFNQKSKKASIYSSSLALPPPSFRKILGALLTVSIIQLHTLYLVHYKETREEKEKNIEEKKFALVAKVIWGHAFSIGLIAHIQNE